MKTNGIHLFTFSALLLTATTVGAQSREDRIVGCIRHCELDTRQCMLDAKRSAKSLETSLQMSEMSRRNMETGLNQIRIKRGLAPQAFNPPTIFTPPNPTQHLAEGIEDCQDSHRECALQCR
jgi:hypothetical protein